MVVGSRTSGLNFRSNAKSNASDFLTLSPGLAKLASLISSVLFMYRSSLICTMASLRSICICFLFRKLVKSICIIGDDRFLGVENTDL